MGYILLNPEKFVEAVRAVKPEALVGYGRTTLHSLNVKREE